MVTSSSEEVVQAVESQALWETEEESGVCLSCADGSSGSRPRFLFWTATQCLRGWAFAPVVFISATTLMVCGDHVGTPSDPS